MDSQPARIAFLFVDGFGISGDDRSVLRTLSLPTLGALTNGFAEAPHDAGAVAYRVLDATLGVEGLPQSATGQTTLLTGVNAAQVLGRHQGPHPGSRMQALLAEQSIQVWARRRQLRLFHANGYRAEYLERVLAARRNMLSAFGFAARAAGESLLDLDDPQAHRPGYWSDAAEAGRAFAAASDAHDLSVLEYWALDYSGHRDRAAVPARLAELDAFVGAFVSASSASTLVITSDHGNAEEPWHERHTRNPVPFIAHGPAAHSVPSSMSSIEGVAGWIRIAMSERKNAAEP